MSSETPDASKDLIKKEPESVDTTTASAATATTSSNSSSSPAVGTATTTTTNSLPAANSNPITAAVTSNPTLTPKVLVVTNSVVAGKSDSAAVTLGTNPTLLVATSAANASTSASNASVTPVTSALTVPSSANKPLVNSSSSSTPSVTQLLNKTVETAGNCLPNALTNNNSPALPTNQSTVGNLSVSNNTAAALPQTPAATAPTVTSNNTNSTATTNSTAQTNGETSSSENDKEKSSSVVVLNKQRLQELVAEIDSNEQLDEDVEDMLLNIADDFIDNLVSNACLVAKHRGAKNVEVKDVQLILEKNYNLYIPGFGSLPLNEEFKNAYKKSPATEAHKQRMALIKKTLKKF